MRRRRRVGHAIAALLTAVTLAFGSGCALHEGPGQATNEELETTTADGGKVESEDQGNQGSAPWFGRAVGGKPWTNSNAAGNIGMTRPEAVDDLYAHYNYDFLKENADTQDHIFYIMSAVNEMADGVVSVIDDATKKGHELDQLRILFDQARDFETLKEVGYDEVMPFIDAVDACDTIDDLNDLLCSADFPFDPFIKPQLAFSDKRGMTEATLEPNFIFTVYVMSGATYYQDTDDPAQSMINAAMLMGPTLETQTSLQLMGLGTDEAEEATASVLDFEREYGKLADYATKYLDQDFGAYAASRSVLTLDELEARLKNIPVRGMLEKHGYQDSEHISVDSMEWLERLDGLWVPASLETMKWSAKARVAADLKPYVYPGLYADFDAAVSDGSMDADTFAFEACSTPDAMSLLVGRTYVDEVLGDMCKERLRTMSEELVDAYADLAAQTPWLSDESRKAVLEKLENMTLNVLEPAGATIDYSSLDLTPTEQGGTLVSNYLATKRYNDAWRASMIGQPAWDGVVFDRLSTTTFNCFYDALSNSANIMPGYVTSTVYRDDMSDEELFGRFGFTFAHEVSHGFDFAGSQFSAYGTPEPVLSADDVEDFVARVQRLIDYYDGIEIGDGMHANGVNVSVEAAADLTGMQVCLRHLAAGRGGDTAVTTFFEGVAEEFASVFPAGMTAMLATDSHPLEYLRVNVNAQMFEDFYRAYGCKEGDGMYLAPDGRINIWGPDATGA